jgi:glycosyltransferase involved in cell wall biosynthesis
MVKILILVNWLIYKDLFVSREELDFLKYWPSNVTVDVVGIERGDLLYTLEKLSRVHLQSLKTFRRMKDYDLIVTFDSTSAPLFALLRSKLRFYRAIPHIMVDVGMPRAIERFIPEQSSIMLDLLKHVSPTVVCEMLKQMFNPKSVSHIVFHSNCQRSFYRDTLGFSDDMLSYIPFGIESEYFKPEPVEGEDYIYVAGEFRDFNSLLRVYEKRHEDLPELRIRSGLPSPNYLPPKVNWLPRAPISTFKTEVLKSRFVIVPLHYSIRSAGVMTCLQSMALGKAVLVSRVPSIDGYIVNGETALYYEPYDQNDLFKKISLLLKEDKLVDTMGKRARMEVEAKFAVKNLGMQLWNCVSFVLKSQNS